MGGIAYGLRNGLHINASNPASYSAVDSLTFILDAGMSLQNANFKEGNVKTNAKNSTFDYIAMQFRLVKGLGLTAGFLPYSTDRSSINNTVWKGVLLLLFCLMFLFLIVKRFFQCFFVSISEAFKIIIFFQWALIVVNYINKFTNIKPVLHSWDTTILVMMGYSFYTFLSFC